MVVKNRGKLIFLAGFFVMLAAGWFGFPRMLYQKTNQPIQFSHQVHTGDKAGMTCEDCHSFQADGRFNGIPSIGKCAGCHMTLLGNSAGEKVLVEKYVATNTEIPWLVYSRQPENAYFSHVQHVRIAKIQCERCHGPHGASDTLRPYESDRLTGYSRDIWGHSLSRIHSEVWDGKKMDNCASCHEQQGVSNNCLLCHK
jgi:menaquinone reductase, multiheme cytochrome c subunit